MSTCICLSLVLWRHLFSPLTTEFWWITKKKQKTLHQYIEVLKDDAIRVYQKALDNTTNAKLFLMEETGLHCLPAFAHLPEALNT